MPTHPGARRFVMLAMLLTVVGALWLAPGALARIVINTMDTTGGGVLASDTESDGFDEGSTIGVNPGSTGTVTVDGVGSFAVHYGDGSPFDPTQVVLSDFFRECIADFNADGAVDTQDVLVFLNAWGRRDPSADCDADGVVDTRDVLCFPNAGNAGC